MIDFSSDLADSKEKFNNFFGGVTELLVDIPLVYPEN